MTDYLKLRNGSYVSVAQLERDYLSGNRAVYEVDLAWFMTQSSGRLVNPSAFSGIRDLLGGTIRPELGPGVYNLVSRSGRPDFDPAAIFVHGGTLGTGAAPVTYQLSNYMIGSETADYGFRAYVFGNTSFRVVSGVLYINEMGQRELINVQIKPLNGNFNFETDDKNFLVRMTNNSFKYIFDPEGRGKGVDLNFIEADAGKVYTSITSGNLYALDNPESHQFLDPMRATNLYFRGLSP